MKTVRVTSGLGFYGDNWLPVQAAIEHGDVQYVCSDHLAELTLAILQKDRQKDPAAGYARDLLPMMTQLWPAAASRGVKFVLNAGGLNPQAAALALQQLFAAKGWRARVAVVMGDNLLDQIDALQAQGEALMHMDTGAAFDTVRADVVFANVYLGAQPIAKALATEMGTPLISFARHAVHAVLMVLIFGPKLGTAIIRTHRPWLQIIRGLMLVGFTLSFFSALGYLPQAEATAIAFITPFFVMLLAGPLLGERVTIWRWLGAAGG
ncbi:MAG: acyclic terpene utilization AtuA family protein, partial [Betaproteobacteria bacterium]|nr:acyclic terpene utilization AtuA family protein [Betaproteobacteria bacterium]